MIKIKASFFGPIKRPWPDQSRDLDVVDGGTVEALLSSLGYTPMDAKRVAVVVNGTRSSLSTPLKEGDDVRFVLLAGGG